MTALPSSCPGRGSLHPASGDRGPEYACAACFWQVAGPTDCRGEPLDLEPMFAALAGADARDRDAERVQDFDEAAARYAALRPEVGIALLGGPATSADLLELDAVPDPVDSDAPRATFSAEETTQRNRRSERP